MGSLPIYMWQWYEWHFFFIKLAYNYSFSSSSNLSVTFFSIFLLSSIMHLWSKIIFSQNSFLSLSNQNVWFQNTPESVITEFKLVLINNYQVIIVLEETYCLQKISYQMKSVKNIHNSCFFWNLKISETFRSSFILYLFFTIPGSTLSWIFFRY